MQTLARKFSCIGEVRGLGLMWGIELVRSDGSPDPFLLDEILEELKDRRFLLGKTGAHRNVLTLLPPLIVDLGSLLEMVEDMEKILAQTTT